MKPRLNLHSIRRMAERNRISIQASAYRSSILALISHFLDQTIKMLDAQTVEAYQLAQIEADLEIIEQALTHLSISLPYNEVLTTPRIISLEQTTRLTEILEETKRNKRHLRLASKTAVAA